MTIDERKKWIDRVSYEELLYKWRFEPAGSVWFAGDLGDYYAKKMKEKRDECKNGEDVTASKKIGWEIYG